MHAHREPYLNEDQQSGAKITVRSLRKIEVSID
jgi:hypothetical protein